MNVAFAWCLFGDGWMLDGISQCDLHRWLRSRRRTDRLGGRISTLEARLKQLKARQSALEARKRTVAQRRQRQDDVRRNILVGAIVFDKVASGEFQKATLWGWSQKRVKREEDRRLFESVERDAEGMR